ncbi:unnamed protein product [Paramecium primaurelia]|uniref:Cyclin-dependent kinase 2 homolog n=1 Tax=Paramecium primaurelia TaxID=5886 RepID=A0A8S1MGB5_PARPR|nr:unnamed protein product [Paramecium primaurelia]
MQSIDHEHYTKVKKLPGGAYGKIYLCKCEKPIHNKRIFQWIPQLVEIETHPQFVVIKKFKPLKKRVGLDIDSLREVRFMNTMIHQNLNIPKHVFMKTSKKRNDDTFGSICFVYDHMVSLFEILSVFRESNESIQESDIKLMLLQILQGFEELHQKMILHRDFKPENVLVTKDGILKITDFGLARLWEDKPMTTQTCTMQYRSPELFFNAQKYGPALDVWAIGCVFAEFYLKQPLFSGESEIKILSKMVNILGNPTEKNWPGFLNLPQVVQFEKRDSMNLFKLLPKMSNEGIDLLSKMLQYDPNKRISIKDALKHNYFNQIESQNLSKKLMQIIYSKLN